MSQTHKRLIGSSEDGTVVAGASLLSIGSRVAFSNSLSRLLDGMGRGRVTGAELDALIENHPSTLGEAPKLEAVASIPVASFEGISNYGELSPMQKHRLRSTNPALEAQMRANAGLSSAPMTIDRSHGPAAQEYSTPVAGLNADETSLAAKWDGLSARDRDQLMRTDIATFSTMKNAALRRDFLARKA